MDKETITTLPLAALQPYPGHIFAPYEGERLDGMIASVKEHGVITPIIAHEMGDGAYQILSGHNRINAAKEAGLTEIAAVVHANLSDDEAEFIVTETNLMQRSFADLKHSERARALKNHLEALKKLENNQGRRSDLVTLLDDQLLFHGETKVDSLKKAGEQYALSKTTVFRYVRLAKLPDELLELVDGGRIQVVAAIEISFLFDDEMRLLAELMDENPKCKIGLKTAKAMREEAGRLTRDMLQDILDGKRGENGNAKPAKRFRRVSMSTATLDRLADHTHDLSAALERIAKFYFKGLDSGEFGDILSELGDQNETPDGTSEDEHE